jgi:hypothetical protein
MDGRAHVVPEDVVENIPSVCSHRVFLRGDVGATRRSAAEAALDEVLRGVAAPA